MVLLGTDSFSGEREQRTLESLLLTPVARGQLVTGKLLAILSLWLGMIPIAVPYILLVAKGTEVTLAAVFLLLIPGTLLVSLSAGIGVFVSGFAPTNLVSFAGTFLVILQLATPTQLPGSVIGLLAGSLGAGAFLAGRPGHAAAQTADSCAADDDDSAETAETEDKDDVQEEVECGAQDENEADEANEIDEANEADEADETTPAGLSITADQAQAIVEEANPGATTLAVEYDRENGRDLFEVELDNGQDVTVDVATGEIVAPEARD